jgi:hypothetical protein
MPAEVRIEHRYPAAWGFVLEHGPETVAVLHDLLAHAHRDGDRLIVVASVRQVAARLGFASKDTVHRRLRQLQRAGVVRRVPADAIAPFACPTYLVDLTGTGITLVEPIEPPDVTRPRPRDRARVSRDTRPQLDLFPATARER